MIASTNNLGVLFMNRNEKNVNKLTMLGMMTALVFVSNYLRITMPIAIGGRTSFTLANIMCCLSVCNAFQRRKNQTAACRTLSQGKQFSAH